jgi:cytidine deaminase
MDSSPESLNHHRLFADRNFTLRSRNSCYNQARFLDAGMAKDKFSRRDRERLIRAARSAMKNAYAPFSHFRVGAALLTSKNEIFVGCNVENSSYGMTNCAERTAIFSAVAKSGPELEIRALAVVTDQDVSCSPCGACRQVIYEFGPEAIVFYKSSRGWTHSPIRRLLPEGFRLQ